MYLCVLSPSVVAVRGMAPHGEEGTLMAVVMVEVAGAVGLAGVVEVAGEAVGPAGVVEVAGVPARHTGAVGLGPLLVSVSLILMASWHMNVYTQIFLNLNCCSLL